MDFEGTEHGALADAINTAKVLKLLESKGEVQNIIENIKNTLKGERLQIPIGWMFDLSSFNIGV